MSFIENIKTNEIFLGNIPTERRPVMAIFLSGTGSNAEKLLENSDIWNYTKPAVLVTDAPEKSRAAEIAKKYSLPIVEISIREFYHQHGLKTISLATEAGREVRELWTDALRKQLTPYNIDFAVLAGFEPLSNITDDFPCLNVHPGDLTVTDENGKRLYVGLHSRPVEQAILAGETHLRASVIIAGRCADASKDMDNGLLLGVSQKVAIDFEDLTLDELKNIYNNRSGKKPAGGWKDTLELLALRSQEKLKYSGDHVILPLVVRDFARGCFAFSQGKLWYRHSSDSSFFEASNEYTIEGVRKK